MAERFDVWRANDEATRHVSAAQLAMWLVGAVPALGFAYLFVEIALGHPDERARLDVPALQVAVGIVWMFAGVASGWLIRRHRRAGVALGAVLLVILLVVAVPQSSMNALAAVPVLVVLWMLRRAHVAMRRLAPGDRGA